MLRAGYPLSQITEALCKRWSPGARLLPVTDGPLRTRLTVEGDGEIGFQEYFVQRQHDVAVTSVRFDGADATVPAPGVIEAVTDAARLVIAPSNPIVSIAPLLALLSVVMVIADHWRADVEFTSQRAAMASILSGNELH